MAMTRWKMTTTEAAKIWEAEAQLTLVEATPETRDTMEAMSTTEEAAAVVAMEKVEICKDILKPDPTTATDSMETQAHRLNNLVVNKEET